MSKLIFRQLFESISCTYTYILGCASTKTALIIDPVLETVDRDIKLLHQLGFELKYAANTHVHADHVTGSGLLKNTLGSCKSVLSDESGGKADLFVHHKDFIEFGKLKLEVRATPGHTNGCISYVLHSHRMAFTGDSLLIRGCGRTDFQQGCSERLYDSVHNEIFSLPKDYSLYPAHDYQGNSVTTVEEEIKFNLRMTKSKKEFVEIMQNLNLPYPKQIDKSLPANLVCGIYELMDENTRKMIDGSFKGDPSQKH